MAALTASDTGTYSPHPVNALFEQTVSSSRATGLPVLHRHAPGSMVKNGGTATLKWRRFEQETPTTTALTEDHHRLVWQRSFFDTPTNTDVTALVCQVRPVLHRERGG
jgi:hypothetical protein